MPIHVNWLIVSKNEYCMEVDIPNNTKDLFNRLNETKHFINDTKLYDMCCSAQMGLLVENMAKTTEMTNREFLLKFIDDLSSKNKAYRAKSKRLFVIHLILILLLVYPFVAAKGNGSKVPCFVGVLNILACAGLVCSLVFNLSLAVLIPSAIILGCETISLLANTVILQVHIYKVRQEKGTDIDDFFNLVGEINQYLDTHDLPPKEISSGEQIFDKSQIKEKIKNADMNKENNVTTEENDDKESEKSKNK